VVSRGKAALLRPIGLKENGIIEKLREMSNPNYPFIRHHHECFDGKAYPDGLAGEEIPLESRMPFLAHVDEKTDYNEVESLKTLFGNKP
jgi:hypothetical protein